MSESGTTGDSSTGRRTVLQAVAGTTAAGVGVFGTTGTASAGDGDLETPDDLDSGFDIYVFSDESVTCSSAWENSIDNFLTNIPDYFENHLGIEGTVETNNYYCSSVVGDLDYYDNGYSAIPDYAQGEGSIPIVIVDVCNENTWRGGSPGLGRSYHGSGFRHCWVNQQVPPASCVGTPADYREPMLMHEMGHLCMTTDVNGTDTHGKGDQYQYLGDFEPTAMATAYCICGQESYPSQDCSGSSWDVTCDIGDIYPRTEYSACTSGIHQKAITGYNYNPGIWSY